ncbi:hypothetical protein [Teredinibacter sp. KSP-S5-2]|uniref:hypothetical protein n=1 Tax=Teredinibacter sp. KSP-S5-2 TaxID=3034506 RepID=UPI0029352587|nr:hypothetical protein [Teredinibacter sp. KSP-S5-2]WNO10416.1 hypothetical protein P5V12_04455 [Teredinibacter sp. KSP-S5-2]
MSTRSCIALQLEDNAYVSIYCHFDGDPSGVGKALSIHFNEYKKAKSLIDLGNLSYVEDDNAYAYHRDGGESWQRNRPTACISKDTLLNHAEKMDAAYLYIFQNGKWEILKYSPQSYPRIYTKID